MTYAGLKSMIYAGLSREDPRVKAAFTYITRHYTLDENPGLGQRGSITTTTPSPRRWQSSGSRRSRTPPGSSHDWRAELIAALAKRQQPDGGWVNPADRFMEGDPNLVTAYALLALAYTRQRRTAHAPGTARAIPPQRSFGVSPFVLAILASIRWPISS